MVLVQELVMELVLGLAPALEQVRVQVLGLVPVLG